MSVQITVRVLGRTGAVSPQRAHFGPVVPTAVITDALSLPCAVDVAVPRVHAFRGAVVPFAAVHAAEPAVFGDCGVEDPAAGVVVLGGCSWTLP